jgi:outer membrane protein TolC
LAIIMCLSALVYLGGCASLDPWGEFDALPESRSQSFDVEIDAEGSAPTDSSDIASELAGRTLSLGECVTVALEHNPRTAESWQSIRAAAARTGRAKADYLPIIGFTSSAARGDTVELDG